MTRAFTLIELLVVVTIVVVLLALLAPALDKAMEQAQRAVCGANLNTIHSGAFTYGWDNQRKIFICRQGAVQKAFDAGGQPAGSDGGPGYSSVDWVAAMSTVGLASSSPAPVAGGIQRRAPSKAWDCPSRGFKSNWDDAAVNGSPGAWLIVGYQYLGGVRKWRNVEPPYTYEGRSPLSLRSGSREVLAADTTMKLDGRWGGGRATAFGGGPSHKAEDGSPEGHNQITMDGSVEWVDFDRMYYITTWGANSRNTAFFFYQTELGDFDPTPGISGAEAWQ